MSTLRNTLALGGREVVPSLTVRRVIGVMAFAAASAFGARIALPIPGTPVPFTLVPLIVLLAGTVLGARLGAASQVLYLAAGVSGLPVFVAGGGAAYLLGPTGGYLLAYPAAAFLAGALGRSGTIRALPGLVAAMASIYVGGIAWLAVVGSVDTAVALGLRPFALADLVKVLMVVLLMGRFRDRALRLFGS